MVDTPIEQVRDSHSLLADGRITLFELTPSGGGTGTVRFKPDNDVTYRTNLYTGVPLALTGEKKTADAGLMMPRLVIGEDNVDLSMFKPLVYDGYLDNATIIRITILLDDMINNRLIREIDTYRVKRVEQYSRTQVSMQLATLSDSLGFSLPYKTFVPPAFPSVTMT